MSGTDLVQSLVRMVRTSLICLVIIDLSLVDSLMSNQHVINGDTTVTCLQLPGLAVTEDVNRVARNSALEKAKSTMKKIQIKAKSHKGIILFLT